MPRDPKPWYWKARDLWCVDIGKKRHRLAKGKDARKEALEEFHRLMVGLGMAPKEHPATVADVFEAFLEDVALAVERGERAASTYEGYVRFLSSAAARFGTAVAAGLTPHQVHLWTDAADHKWNSTTRASAVTAVKATFRWAARRGLIPTNPIRDMAKPTRQRRTAVLTDDQVRTVLEFKANTPFADLIFSLWESGCRPSEVTTLTADRVDLAAGTWSVRNKTRRKTGREYRTVYLTPALMELSRRLVAHHPEGLVFRNSRGREWTRNMQAVNWYRLRRDLGWGAEATSYAVRHRYARTALAAGLDASDVAALMGHKGSRMVDTVYGGWDTQDDRLRAAARRVRPGMDEGSGDGVE